MNRVVLQIPMEKTLRSEAEIAAISQGFSSLQEAIRVFVKRLADRKMTIVFEDTVILSKKAARRYDKIDEDYKNNRNIFEAKNTKDLMKQLSENPLP